MAKLPASLSKLIGELSKLPGVGPKTAQRLSFYLLKREQLDLDQLAEAVQGVKAGTVFCSVCHNMADRDPCATCVDPQRDRRLICVVEDPLDALAIDKTGQFSGVFHVLGGVLNPLEGVGPEQLNAESLVARIGSSEVREVILATNPSLEGETTAAYLSKTIHARYPEVKVTRIARGLPMGGDLEYADDITLLRAIEGRREA